MTITAYCTWMRRNIDITAILPPWPTYDVAPTHSFRLLSTFRFFFIIYFAVPCTSSLDSTSQFLLSLYFFPFPFVVKYTRYLVTIPCTHLLYQQRNSAATADAILNVLKMRTYIFCYLRLIWAHASTRDSKTWLEVMHLYAPAQHARSLKRAQMRCESEYRDRYGWWRHTIVVLVRAVGIANSSLLWRKKKVGLTSAARVGRLPKPESANPKNFLKWFDRYA